MYRSQEKQQETLVFYIMADGKIPTPRKRTLTAKGLEYELELTRKDLKRREKDFMRQIRIYCGKHIATVDVHLISKTFE